MAIRIKKDGTEQRGLVDDDVIQPFSLDVSGVRGRIVRLGPVLRDIFTKHEYPAPVSALLTEVTALCLLLGAMLKYEGVFSLQIKGDGPITTLVADVTSRGHVRSYAGFDKDAVRKAAKRKKDVDNNHYHLLGKGHVSFIIDQKAIEGAQQYQGIVELKGTSLVEAVEHYFTQSEQIQAGFRLAVHPQDGMWRAGAIMIQEVPDEGGTGERKHSAEDWNRSHLLMKTCTDEELLSPGLHSTDVLYRLFHEEGVRVYAPMPVRHVCRCSRERVSDVLRSLPRDEMEETCKKDGVVLITCEFCSKRYSFDMKELEEVYKHADQD